LAIGQLLRWPKDQVLLKASGVSPRRRPEWDMAPVSGGVEKETAPRRGGDLAGAARSGAVLWFAYDGWEAVKATIPGASGTRTQWATRLSIAPEIVKDSPDVNPRGVVVHALDTTPVARPRQDGQAGCNEDESNQGDQDLRIQEHEYTKTDQSQAGDGAGGEKGRCAWAWRVGP